MTLHILLQNILLIFSVSVIFPISISGAELNYEIVSKMIHENDYINAEKSLLKLIEEEPDNIIYLNDLMDIYISMNDFKNAELFCIKIIDLSPDDYKILLKTARLYSWMGRFDDSILFYERAIRIESGEITPKLEKARVLWWHGKKTKSQNIYREISDGFSAQWVFYEAKGKLYLSYGRINKAIKSYQKSLEIKPANEEVLFDLAQVYSYGGDYEKADNYYKLLLSTNPYNTAAIKSQAKNALNINPIRMEFLLNSWNATSIERNTDVNFISSNFHISKDMSQYKFGLKVSDESFSFTQNSTLEKNSITLNLDYNSPLYYGFGAGYNYGKISSIDIDRSSFYIYGWRRMYDRLVINSTYSKINLINNYESISTNINKNNFLLSLGFVANDILMIGSSIQLGAYNDNNRYSINTLFSRQTLLKPPKNLYSIFEIENMRYRFNTNNYFSPDNHLTLSATLGFIHDLSKDGIYYGANRFYFHLKSKIIVDNNNEYAFQPNFELAKEFYQRFFITVEMSATESSYYQDTSIKVQLRNLF